MKLIKLKCTNCDGFTELHVEDGQKMVFCPCCGQKYVVDDEKLYVEVNVNKTERKIDEARIKEAEVREKIRLRELEFKQEAQKSKEEGTVKLLKGILSVVLGLVCGISMFMGLANLSVAAWSKGSVFLIFGILVFFVLRMLWKKKK